MGIWDNHERGGSVRCMCLRVIQNAAVTQVARDIQEQQERVTALKVSLEERIEARLQGVFAIGHVFDYLGGGLCPCCLLRARVRASVCVCVCVCV
jgi:hypothetical protein